MKKHYVLLNILLISISPLFRGLFFTFESYIFITILSLLISIYFLHIILKPESILLLKFGCLPLSGLLTITYFNSIFVSVNPRANIDSILQYTAVFLLFIILDDYFKDNKFDIPSMVFLPLIGTGFIAALLGMAGYTKAFPYLIDTINGERIGSTLQYANTAAIYFLILIVLVLSLIITSENLLVKAILAGIGNTLFMALFFTGSRGVYVIIPFLAFFLLVLAMPAGARLKCIGYTVCITLPILVSMKGFSANSKITNWISASKWVILSFGISALASLVFTLILRIKLNLKIKYSIMSVIAAFTLVFYYINHAFLNSALAAFAANSIPKTIFNRLNDINLTTNSAFIRIVFDQDALKLIRQHWLFGLGGGGFAAMYQSVQDFFYTARLVHNHYLQVFVEAGIMGFLAFTSLVVITCVYYILAAIRTKDWKDRVYIAGSFCAFVALATHSAIDFNLDYNSMKLIFWCLMAVGSAYYHNAPGRNLSSADNISGTIIENQDTSKKNLAPVILTIVSLIVMTVSGYLIVPSHYAVLADKYKDSMDREKALVYYEKASRLDWLNPVYHAELAEQYRWMANCSKTENEKNQWIGMAVNSGENAVKYSPYYPYYRQILTMAYFEAGKPVKAWEQAETLVKVQPRKIDNYDLLARGRLEAGLSLLRENKTEEAGTLLRDCVEIANYPGIKMNAWLAFNIGKADLLLGNFDQAEKLLNTARSGSLEVKMNSDRLLYIINEETGRASKNDVYKGVPWMGAVRLTPDYKEIKQILGSKVLNGI